MAMFLHRSACRYRLFFQAKLLANQKYLSDDSVNKRSLYDILGVPSSATHSEIKKAYYDLTLKYHPDRNENSEFAATKFREVTEAYEILGSYTLKKKYDKGVPIAAMKEDVKTHVDHRVKYQEFFDSRTERFRPDLRSEEVSELGRYRQRVHDEDRKTDEEYLKDRMSQRIVTIFFLILIYLRYTRDA